MNFEKSLLFSTPQVPLISFPPETAVGYELYMEWKCCNFYSQEGISFNYFVNADSLSSS
jgi:hypothetical protein